MRKSNEGSKSGRSLWSGVLLGLLALTISFDLWFWHEYEGRSELRPVTTSQSLSTTEGKSLIKFGLPIPHLLVGPYRVLRNIGYISGYDSGIQDPRWVETRFFAVTNPISTARPEQFSPDERIESQFRVTTDFWRDTGYDRGHMAPNWGVSICYGRAAQVQTFLLTNVIPQAFRREEDDDIEEYRGSFFAIVKARLAGSSYQAMALAEELSVDDILGIYSKPIAFELQTLVEQAIALLGKLLESDGVEMAPAAQAFPEHLRFGVPTAAARVLLGAGLRHRGAAVYIGRF
jgi:hypothetical protein